MKQAFLILSFLTLSYTAGAMSPPWYYNWNFVKQTIATDPCAIVEDLRFPASGSVSAQNPIVIPIKVCDIAKAKMLRVFIKKTIGMEALATEISYNSQVIDETTINWSLSELKQNFTGAFAANSYFVEIKDGSFGPATIFKPEVVQFFCDNIAVPSGYCHSIAADAFSRVLNDKVSGFHLVMTTALKK